MTTDQQGNPGVEGGEQGHSHLRGKKTLQEILDVAMDFEQTARDFYTALVPKVSRQIRYLVEELANEERMHHELFRDLASDPQLSERIRQEIDIPLEDHRFSDYIHLPDLGAHPDEQSILQYALYREHAAMEQYRDLAASTEPGPIHDLFDWLANEETRHKRELERIYYQLVHGGGV